MIGMSASEKGKQVVSAVGRFVDKCKAKSLVNRNELLLNHLGRNGLASGNPWMSRDDLAAFDKERHELIHANVLLREDFAGGIEEQCVAVFDHAHNLIRRVGEWIGFDWEEDLDNPFI